MVATDFCLYFRNRRLDRLADIQVVDEL
jgi:hypothetical protein